MLLTLKTLLTFSPLEMGPVPQGKLIKYNQFVLLPSRNVLEKKKIIKCMQNKPDPMLLEVKRKLPRDFCRLR